ncbi:MAG: hypothetical protein ACK2UO_17065, partial [Caldilineaceae bacterium]
CRPQAVIVRLNDERRRGALMTDAEGAGGNAFTVWLAYASAQVPRGRKISSENGILDVEEPAEKG